MSPEPKTTTKPVPKDPVVASVTGVILMVAGVLDLAAKIGITADQLVIIVGSAGAIVAGIRALWLKPDEKDPVIAAATGAVLAVLGAFHLGERFALDPDLVATIVGAILSTLTSLRARQLSKKAKEAA